VYEVDFLPVESTGGPSSKSGDAITVRFTRAADGSQRVIVIDAGFGAVGQDVVDHVMNYYDTTHVDLVISTHPDGDHLNGLVTVIEQLDVEELLIHQPRLHAASVADFTNLEAVDTLIKSAKANGTTVTEPFEWLSRFEHQVLILGPSKTFYESKLAEHLDEESGGRGAVAKAVRMLSSATLATRDLLSKALSFYPAETLGEDGVTSPRNETSVVMLLSCDGERLLFTGDAGLEGLGRAVDNYEDVFGSFQQHPLRMFHVPHHGSRRNLSPSLLDRVIGTRDGGAFGNTSAIVSSAKADLKHPSPKVMNALGRRGATALATEGGHICHFSDGAGRPGWGPVTPVGPLAEDDDA
jgi:beta-lactamase superfamily II metal-dependent hydrolase